MLRAGKSWVQNRSLKVAQGGLDRFVGISFLQPPCLDAIVLPKEGGELPCGSCGDSSGSTLKKKCLFLTMNQRNERHFIDRVRLRLPHGEHQSGPP